MIAGKLARRGILKGDEPDHDWCPLTEFCLRCGASAADVADGQRPATCAGGDTVIAVSATLARRRFQALGLTR